MRECDKQEKRVCKGLGGKRQIGSGATPFLKADGVLDNLLIECKTKDKPSKSMSIQKGWFDKVRDEAFATGKDGAILVFSFGDGKDYVAEEFEEFKEHYKAYKTLQRVRDIIYREHQQNAVGGLKGTLKEILDILEEE